MSKTKPDTLDLIPEGKKAIDVKRISEFVDDCLESTKHHFNNELRLLFNKLHNCRVNYKYKSDTPDPKFKVGDRVGTRIKLIRGEVVVSLGNIGAVRYVEAHWSYSIENGNEWMENQIEPINRSKQLTIEDANPCPFCKGEMEHRHTVKQYLRCTNTDCYYASPYANTIHEAVLVHNSVRLGGE